MSSLQGWVCKQMIEFQGGVYMYSREYFCHCISAWEVSKGVDEWKQKGRLFIGRK